MHHVVLCSIPQNFTGSQSMCASNCVESWRTACCLTPKVLLSCPGPCGVCHPTVSSCRHRSGNNMPTGSASLELIARLTRALEELEPGSSLQRSPGQVRPKVSIGGVEAPRVSSGTCACGTAPLAGPGTEVSRSAAGRDARAGQWHWPAPGGPESAYGPGSPLELERSRTRGMGTHVLSSFSLCFPSSSHT